MRNIWMFILCIILSAYACNKSEEIDNPVPQSFFIFGHYYGFCGGEGCVEIFKIEDESLLFEDITDRYPRDSFYNGFFRKLSIHQFYEVKDLPAFLPEELLNTPDTVFGMPDAYDQGGLFIERKTDSGAHSYWHLDQDKSNIPEFLHDFHDKVNEAIRNVNE